MTRSVSCIDVSGATVSDSLCLPCDTGVPCECNIDADCVLNAHCDLSARRCVCKPGWLGEKCDTVGLVSASAPCADGVLDAAKRCCLNAIDSSSGLCCGDADFVVSRDGRCCSGWLDGCGNCNGTSSGIDALGVCCRTPVSPSGRCCDMYGGTDNCGVCGGTNGCPARVRVVVRVNITSVSVMELTETFARALSINTTSVLGLTVDTEGLGDGDPVLTVHVVFADAFKLIHLCS
jgi:hypothetical protein